MLGNKGMITLETNKLYSEKPPPPPAILRLINDIEKDVFETIPIGGASWIPETAVQYKGEFITSRYRMDETKLQMEAFVKYIREGEAPMELAEQGYHASLWCLLAENAIKSGKAVTLPKGYEI